MLLTAQRVVARGTRTHGINVYCFAHGPYTWPRVPDGLLPDVNPGELVQQWLQIDPGGNYIVSYLDVVAPDDVPPMDLYQRLASLLGQSYRRVVGTPEDAAATDPLHLATERYRIRGESLLRTLREVLFGATVALATLLFGMKRFDVTYWGKLATFLLMFAFPGFMLGSSSFPGHQGFEIASWILGIPGLILSYYTAVTYIPTIRRSLREGREAAR